MEIKVNLLLIATNKYAQFLQPLIDSLDKHFLKDCEVIYNIFTDQEPTPVTHREVRIHKIEHKPWPHPTLMRFRFFNEVDLFSCIDYVYYIDADTIITDTITEDDILHDLVAVQHCGFVGKRGSYETRKESICHVSPQEGEIYYGGGFYGGDWKSVMRMFRYCDLFIMNDLNRGITPVWHDESALNRYLIDNKPTKVLTPSYHYPQNEDIRKRCWKSVDEYPCKILLLDKAHEEVRS